MKAFPLFGLLVLLALPVYAVEQPIAEFVTSKGRVYKNLVVKKIEPDGIRVLHAEGASKIGFDDLTPEQRKQFGLTQEARDKFTEEAEAGISSSAQSGAAASVGNPAVSENTWQPKNAQEVADCALFVNVSKKIDAYGREVAGAGSAFLCNVGGYTYIYSNAHNFDGTTEFEIEDKNGTKYSDFASVEIAAKNQAYWEQKKWGGDVVRIRLKTFREKALTLSPYALNNDSSVGTKILITGNTRGQGAITELTGEITNIEKEQIIIHNVQTERGNSGSPIVDVSNNKVIGILTWGAYDSTNPLFQLWNKQPDETRKGINAGAGLATVRFVPTTFDQLYRQRIAINEIKKNTRLLGLLDTLYPAKSGLFVNSREVVMGEYTIGDLLQESPDHPVVKELKALDLFLRTKAESNIGMSNRDAMKKYSATYARCLSIIRSQRLSLWGESGTAPFFFECQMKRSNLHQISMAYENLIARSIDWYAAQSGTKGETLPIDKRVRFPAFRSGLEGLGIKED